MPDYLKIILLSLCTIILLGENLHAQNTTPANDKIRVGLYISPPFAMKENDRLKGMAIELWEHVASDLDLKSSYTIYPTFEEIVKATEEGRIDVAVTNLTISEKRARLIDFTQPWYDAGLRIMINTDKPATTSEIVKGLRNAGHLTTYLWIMGIIIAATIVTTILDRKFDKEFPKRWRDGLADNLYSVMVASTKGNLIHKNLFGWRGKVISTFWLVLGIFVVAYFTSSITSVMTTLSISGEIHSLSDLAGKRVAVVSGSTSESFAIDNGYDYQSFSQADEAVKSLIEGNVDAIIGDAPVLEYYAFGNEIKSLKVVGKIFKPEKYGFGLPDNSKLTKPLTIEILKAQENGFIQELKLKYFGENH